MVWTLLDTAVITAPETTVILPSVYTEPKLSIVSTTEFTKATWQFLGYVDQLATLPGLGRVRVSSQIVPLESNLIYLDITYPYELRFRCFNWLGDTAIETYKDI